MTDLDAFIGIVTHPLRCVGIIGDVGEDVLIDRSRETSVHFHLEVRWAAKVVVSCHLANKQLMPKYPISWYFVTDDCDLVIDLNGDDHF